MTTSSEPAPIWLDGDKIDEVQFCEELLSEYPMISIHECFFTVNGKVTDESWIKNAILEKLKPFVRRGLSRKITSMLDTLRALCYSPPLPIYHDRIHVANGTLYLDGRFEETKDFCLNRLPVAYDPDAPFPTRWLAFLNDLLIPEDILTLQEFMGYCLIPSTKAQKMLMGKGGEGKSRVGIILSALLGTNMYSGSIAKVETSPFARADLEYDLLLVDDDMKMEALPQTNIIKSLVTAEMPMDLEKKGRQSYQGTMYVRFVGFGNGTLKSLYDRSVGFFSAADHSDRQGSPEGSGGRSFPVRKAAGGDRRHPALGAGRSAPAAGEQLQVHDQCPRAGEHGGEHGRGEQRDSIPQIRGLYRLQGRL